MDKVSSESRMISLRLYESDENTDGKLTAVRRNRTQNDSEFGRQTAKSEFWLLLRGVDTPRVEGVVILRRRLLSKKTSLDREIRTGLLVFDRDRAGSSTRARVSMLGPIRSMLECRNRRIKRRESIDPYRLSVLRFFRDFVGNLSEHSLCSGIGFAETAELTRIYRISGIILASFTRDSINWSYVNLGMFHKEQNYRTKWIKNIQKQHTGMYHRSPVWM